MLKRIVAFHAPAGVEAGGGCARELSNRQMCARGAPRPSSVLYIKRVVAGPGDRWIVGQVEHCGVLGLHCHPWR